MSDAKEVLAALNDKKTLTLPKVAWFAILVLALGGLGLLLSHC